MLHALPSGNLKAAASLFGRSNDNPAINKATSEKNATRRRIQMMSVKTWILGTARTYLLQGVKEVDIKDLVENEVYE